MAAFRGPGVRRGTKLALDLSVYVAAVAMAYLIRLEAWPTDALRAQMMLLLLLLPGVRVVARHALGMQRTSWRLFGLTDVLPMAVGVAAVSAGLVMLRFVMPWLTPDVVVLPYGVIVLEGMLVLAGSIGLRTVTRVIDEHRSRGRTDGSSQPRRALLVGAGRAGALAARELRNHPESGYLPVGFLDDDPTRSGLSIQGVRVLGTTKEVREVAERTGAETIILTMPSVEAERLRPLVERCRESGLPVHTVPGVYELLSGKVGITKVRPVEIEDLLGRGVVALDESMRGRIDASFRGKRILVTGAGGSIGSELCRQLARQKPASLVLLEASENALFEIEQELLDHPAVPCLADIRDADAIDAIFAQHRPQVVLHAAAYKHVPMMEAHPTAAIDNNVRGTRIVAEAAHRHGVERFLLVSTDKAVNPTSIMGASKRVAEMVVHELDRHSETRFCAVRFGNVLGSRGSVLHTFQRQIERGGPVTVTHRDITRFFMTIPEAVRLLIQACAIGTGGEIYLLEMGEPVKIMDLARQMIRLSGLSEAEVPIEITGLRPGEKLHEELLRTGESSRPSEASGILLAESANVDHVGVDAWVDRLERAADQGDIPSVREMLSHGTSYKAPAAATSEAEPDVRFNVG